MSAIITWLLPARQYWLIFPIISLIQTWEKKEQNVRFRELFSQTLGDNRPDDRQLKVPPTQPLFGHLQEPEVEFHWGKPGDVIPSF